MITTTNQRITTVSAQRLRTVSNALPQIPAGLSTFLARAFLGGFVLFLLALASNT
jgi:hypothetical protein